VNPKDFRQSALREMPKETLSRHRDEAVRQFVEWGMTSQTDVASCVELAGRLQGAFSGANEAQMRAGSEMRGERINADVMRRSDRLAAFLLPWVEYIREGLFDKTAVPFRTIEAAIRWLDKTSREHPAPKISDEKEDELEEEIRKQIAAYERRTGHRMRFTIKESELTLYRAGENFPEVLKWPAPAGSPLGILRREIEDMERLSFFRPDVLLVYILVGVKPLLPVIGLGTNNYSVSVPEDVALRREVLRRMPELGGWLIFIFLVPVTIVVHGVAMVTTGPGGTNAITGVLGAWQDSVPMLINTIHHPTLL
jgi:hypothetical protein